MELTKNAISTLEKRYLLRDEHGDIIEKPDDLFQRVAHHVSSVEKNNDARQLWNDVFYKRLSSLEFLPNTPTLINAGKKNGQLSACFVLPIEDSMEGIFTTLKDAAIIHKTGGGTGFDFSSLRPEGSMVSNKTGVSTGPLAFCQVYDKATEVVKQGSTRRGANMMVFRIDHPNILDFIDMKMTPGVMTNFNVSVAVTDEFMDALACDGEYDLHHPFTGITERLSAWEVWDKITSNAWRSAEPGVIFIDRADETSPYHEEIRATNPCGEVPLPAYGACNLGSIDLSKFVKDGDIDCIELRKCVQDSVRFLDNVIDANCYPLPQIAEFAKKYRNIGLGVMGWADALIKMKVSYNSKEALEKASQVMSFINTVGHDYSVSLAEEKGLPSGAPFKYTLDCGRVGRRNATVTVIAPTGSLCILAGCSSGIEPNFAFEYEKHVMDTVLTEYHPLYKAAKNNGGIDKEVFIDAHQVSAKQHVLMQAAFQEHCDSAVSKTINLPYDAEVEDVWEAYNVAWETGCKGITVYRDGSREGVLHKKDEPKTVEQSYCPDCGNEMINSGGCESCIECGLSKCAVA